MLQFHTFFVRILARYLFAHFYFLRYVKRYQPCDIILRVIMVTMFRLPISLISLSCIALFTIKSSCVQNEQ
ncbi:hypothetical protein V8C42DRAFT_310403 [Trichoderma barbatum]